MLNAGWLITSSVSGVLVFLNIDLSVLRYYGVFQIFFIKKLFSVCSKFFKNLSSAPSRKVPGSFLKKI
jgi:hypothetical protein